MAFEIEDLEKFGEFCAQEATLESPTAERDPSLWARLACAQIWGERTLHAAAQYGGGVSQNVKLGLEYAQKPLNAEYSGPISADDEPRFEMGVVMDAAEIMSKFWKHREAFSKWLDSQVIVTKIRD